MCYSTPKHRLSITTEMKQFCIIPTFGIVWRKHFDNSNTYKYGLAFMFACVNFVFRFGKAEKALKEREKNA